jgi:hypothetical protein
MCGIVGVAARTPVNDRRWLNRGADALSHRGPDDAGVWWSADGCVGFAFRRLSIIDLTPAGHQPMSNERGDLCIVFNPKSIDNPCMPLIRRREPSSDRSRESALRVQREGVTVRDMEALSEGYVLGTGSQSS